MDEKLGFFFYLKVTDEQNTSSFIDNFPTLCANKPMFNLSHVKLALLSVGSSSHHCLLSWGYTAAEQ